DIQPKQYISYQRSAFFGKDDPDFRLTFDRQITERRYDLSLGLSSYGAQIIAPNQRLMEVKIAGAMPIWLAKKMSELEIYKISFSKYGTAYYRFIKNQLFEQRRNAIVKTSRIRQTIHPGNLTSLSKVYQKGNF
ncbi:MAG: VTC domain-containing protein, partial [Oscillospiraceae bacterium]|nr:VTC domain-containing protein [Oscillospiraceae bacterium]